MSVHAILEHFDPEILNHLGLFLIGLVSVVSLALLSLPVARRSSSLKKTEGSIRKRIDQTDAQTASEDARFTTIGALNELNWLKAAGRQFERSWRAALLEQRGKALDSPPFESFIRREEILPWFTNRRLAAAIPGVLVALGILGTFIGLLVSLPAVGVLEASAGGDELAKFQEVVKQVVDGLGLAFNTSIVGIFLSVLFIFLDRSAATSFERSVLRLADLVNDQFPVMQESEIDRERFVYLKEANESIKTLGTDIATHLGSTLESQMKPTMLAIQGSVDRLVTFSADEQVEGLRVLVESFTDSMNEALGEQFLELQDVINSTVQSQRNIGSGLESFSSTIRASAEVQQNLIEQTGKVAETLTGSLDRLELVSGLLRDAAEDVVGAGVQIEQSLSAAAESQEAALSAQKQLVEAVGVHSEAMTEARQELEQSWRAAVDQATGTIERIREATREFANSVSDQLVTSLGHFDGALAETVERFSGTLVQVDGSVGELPPAAEAMRESAELTSQRAGELRDAVTGLNDLVGGIVTENLLSATHAAGKLQEVVLAAQETMKGMSELGSQLTSRLESMAVISSEVLDSRESAKEAATRLTALLEEVAEMQSSVRVISSSLGDNGGLPLLTSRLDQLSSTIGKIQSVAEHPRETTPVRKGGWFSR